MSNSQPLGDFDVVTGPPAPGRPLPPAALPQPVPPPAPPTKERPQRHPPGSPAP